MTTVVSHHQDAPSKFTGPDNHGMNFPTLESSIDLSFLTLFLSGVWPQQL